VEILTVLGIAAVLAGISIAALGGMKTRANFNAAASLLSADLNAARQRAITEQARVVAVFLHAGSGVAPNANPDRYVVYVDAGDGFNIATFTPSTPASSTVLSDQTLVYPVSFMPAASGSYAFAAPTGGNVVSLAAPFGAVPAGTPCSFGAGAYSAPYNNRCAVVFQPDGSATFSSGATNGSVAFADLSVQSRFAIVGLVGPTGAVRSFP